MTQADPRSTAVKTLLDHRANYAEADHFSRVVEEREWDIDRENAQVQALEAGLTQAEIDDILDGNG